MLSMVGDGEIEGDSCGMEMVLLFESPKDLGGIGGILKLDIDVFLVGM